MSSGDTSKQTGQLNQDNAWAKNSLGTYSSDAGNYMSNVNATLAAGNPYQSKQYLQDQNLETSGAMNANNTRLAGALRDNAARTGTNTASIGSTLDSSARQGQRDLTQYNAGRDTSNEDKWLQEQQRLLGDQAEGARMESGVYGTQMHSGDNALNDLTSRQNANDQMWSNLTGAALGGAGLGAGIALK